MSTHIAKLMTDQSPLPAGAQRVGWIARHPADQSGLGYAVIRTAAGIEVAWNGETIRSLPRNWRDRVEHTLAESVTC